MDHSGDTQKVSRTRRQLVRALGAGAVLGAPAFRSFAAGTYPLPFANGERPLAQYPQKRPLIVLTTRPPQLETPWEVYNEGVVTPNDAFFVRYHLAGVPTDIDPDAYRIAVTGKVATPLSLSLAELKKKPHGKIYVAFHPHLYSRPRAILPDFAAAFDDADELIIAPIYPAREIDDGTISSRRLPSEVREKGKVARSAPFAPSSRSSPPPTLFPTT